MQPHQPTKPWEMVSIDIMGPYPRTARGKRFILVATDLFTRWTEAFPLGTATAVNIGKLLENEVFNRFGYPQAILTDNGRQFISHTWISSCQRWQAKHWTTAVYHPRANPTERRNQEIKKGLRLHLNNEEHRNWDKFLSTVLFQLRTRQNAATGLSPSKALFGYELSRPGEWKLPKPAIVSNQERFDLVQNNQRRYQGRYNRQPEAFNPFQPDQFVYVKEHPLSNALTGFHAGFAPKWSGPYRVLQPAGGHTYWILRDGAEVKVHHDQLRSAMSAVNHHQQAARKGHDAMEVPHPRKCPYRLRNRSGASATER